MDEFEAALDEVVGIAVGEGVDAVLVAGDLYEHRTPPAPAEGLVVHTLLRLHDAGIAVVAIPGNHDSAQRMEALAPLFGRLGVELAHRVLAPADGGVVRVPS